MGGVGKSTVEVEPGIYKPRNAAHSAATLVGRSPAAVKSCSVLSCHELDGSLHWDRLNFLKSKLRAKIELMLDANPSN